MEGGKFVGLVRLTLQLGHNSEDKGNFKCGVSSKNLLIV